MRDAAPRACRIFSIGRLERHVCRQCHVGDVNDANGIAANARARLGSHHKYRLGQRSRYVSEHIGLHRIQTCHHGSDQGRRTETIMTGVTCNAICPVQFDQSQRTSDRHLCGRAGTTKEEVIDEFIDQKMPYHQARRVITVEEISASAVYLAVRQGPRCAEPRSQSMAARPLSQQLGTQYV